MKGLYLLLKRFIRPYKGLVVAAFGFNLLGAIFGAFQFAALKPVLEVLFSAHKIVAKPAEWSMTIDSLTSNIMYQLSEIIQKFGSEKALVYIGIFLMIMVFLKVLFTYLALYALVPLRNGVVLDIRNQIYNKILELPIGFFSEERKGDIIARMTNDVQEIDNSIMSSLEMLLKEPLLIIIYLGVMIYMSWELTLFVFLLLPTLFDFRLLRLFHQLGYIL